MNRSLDRFCTKHFHRGVRNLPIILVVTQAAMFVLDRITDGLMVVFLAFSPELVLKGQVWRLFGFLLVPSTNNLFYLMFGLLFTYWVSTSLVQAWTSMKFTVYCVGGALCCVLFAGLCTALYALGGGAAEDSLKGILGMTAFAPQFSPYPLGLTLLLAYGTLFPDMQIRIYLILPVKVKWVAVFSAALLLLQMLTPPYSLYSLFPLAAVGNYLLFFGDDLLALFRRRAKGYQSTVSFKSKVRQARQKKGYVHKCAVCGLTDTDAPGMEFRYCSLCSGYQCYCSQHIFSHEHTRG